jgi:hypothetical protein
VRVAFRHYLLDSEGTLYRLPSAALDRMLQAPNRHRLARFAGQRVRSAEVVVEMVDGRPISVVRSVFNMLTFKRDGTLIPPLRDRHVRARAELAMAPDSPARHPKVAEAGSRFVARGGQWKPPAALARRIEQTALGRLKCPRVSPT